MATNKRAKQEGGGPSAMNVDERKEQGAAATATTTATEGAGEKGATKAQDKDAKKKNGVNGASQQGAQVKETVVLDKNGVEVRLPLSVGSKLMCLWRDKKHHPVKIIERKKREKPEDVEEEEDVKGDGEIEDEYEYYVHYDEFNRRLDEWVTIDKLDLSSLVRKSGTDGKANGKKDDQGRSRSLKRRQDSALDTTHQTDHGSHDAHHHGEGHEEFSAAAMQEHEEFTKVKNIQFIELGKFEMETWYFSPFPPEYNNCSRLYFCEFDFSFFRTKKQLQRHMKKVRMLHPPGDEIYRNTYKTRERKDVTLSFFEVDGKKEKIFCQNLCYLAKLFLDHKTLFYDVDLFLFYILCEVDERGCHPVGYFSKEKHSEEGYNLACILMFPSYQRKGYGKLLISFSYELTKKENKMGTPERPLSDLGAVSYYSYWTYTILNVLKNFKGDCISIMDIAGITAIRQQDVISTLQRVNMIQYQKGQHVICAAPELVDKHIREAGNFRYLVDPCKLIWTRYQHTQDYAR